MQLLLKHGADVYARDGSGRSTLELAAACGYVDVAQVLLTAAPDLIAIAGVRTFLLNMVWFRLDKLVTQLCLCYAMLSVGASLEQCCAP